MSKPKARKNGRFSEKKAPRNKNMTILASVAIFTGLSLLLWLGLRSPTEEVVAESAPSTTTDTNAPETAVNAVEPKAGEVPQRGMIAPDFHLTTLKGEDVSLSDYKGEVVAVNLWATWCPPCRAELPGMNAVYDAYKEDGLVMLAVNGREEESLVADFINTEGFTFPVLLDPAGQVMSLYSVYSFPTTYIIDRDGVIQHVQTGPISAQDFEMVIAPLL